MNTYNEMDAQTQAKARALAAHLDNAEPTHIEADDEGVNFEITPAMRKLGDGPSAAIKRAAQLRETLAKIKPFEDILGQPIVTADHVWTYESVRDIGYKQLATAIRQDAPADLKIGLHDVLNTLYFISRDTDDYDHAHEWRDAVRAAFRGDEVTDWRKSQHTSDGEYMVLTDDEADERWNESLDSYLDDCVLPELPETAQRYFDRAAWKRDAKIDGRGHALNSYDGDEDEITDPQTGAQFYCYRTN